MHDRPANYAHSESASVVDRLRGRSPGRRGRAPCRRQPSIGGTRQGVYAAVQPWLTSLSNRITFSLLDMLLAGVAIAVGRAGGARPAAYAEPRARRADHRRAHDRLGRRPAICYSLRSGVLITGVRDSATRGPYEASAVTADAAAAALRQAVDPSQRAVRSGARGRMAGAGRGGCGSGATPLRSAIREAGIARDVVPARPKHTLLDWYFRRAGVDGMTDPFFLETLIAGGILPFERPFVVAHEWSHLAGIADEGEANFTAWLSCVARFAAQRVQRLAVSLRRARARRERGRDRAALSAALGAGPRADLRAIRERYVARRQPAVSRRRDGACTTRT